MIIDLFAGGGGASLGIRQALGRDPDVAINHDPVAVAMHKANHPSTTHYTQDVWKVHPLWATKGAPVDLLWASPDCRDFSKAKGGKPRDRNIRDLAWVVVDWAKTVRPRVILLENVEEFSGWGPLDDKDMRIKELMGTTFAEWVRKIRRCGYRVEWRELRACDHGTPTIRKRLFFIARRDGEPIVWPDPTHGPGLIPYRPAAECIDWSLPCPSIFMDKAEARAYTKATGIRANRPLAENTMKRIAHGLDKFVISNPKPFIVCTNHTASYYDFFRGQGVDEPLKTITQANGFGLVAPTLIQTGYGERPGQSPRSLDLQNPLGTVVAGGTKHALVSAFLAKHYTGVVGSSLAAPIGTITSVDHHSLVAAHLESTRGRSAGAAVGCPAPTITSRDHEALVSSHLIKLRGTSRHGAPVDEPAPTVTAGGPHIGEVRAFMMKYYGTGTGQDSNDPAATITATDRLGLVIVQVEGEPYYIADIGMRMLQPDELKLAQGFPADYIIAEADGKPLTKKDQVRLIGNSVCPPMAEALVRANCAWMIEREAA